MRDLLWVPHFEYSDWKTYIYVIHDQTWKLRKNNQNIVKIWNIMIWYVFGNKFRSGEKISSDIKVLKGCKNARNLSHNCISDFEGLEDIIA